MPNWPVASMGTMIVGLDVHALVVPPAPAPIPVPLPHAGPIFLWSTPTFPAINVFVNSTPACSVGALGYSVHPPVGVPVNPPNTTYWTRYLTNVAMGLTLMGLTIFANMAIAAIASLLPSNKASEAFVKDVTGIDTSDTMAFLNTAMASFAALTQWQTWVKLLMPPLPFPGSQGSVAVGSPTVSVNGGALAFIGPLLGTSCSDIPVVPNAHVLGFTNVTVGVSFSAMVRAIAVSTAQAGVQAGLKAGVEKMTQGGKGCGCK
ncbi:MAG: hypothetical protein ABIW76_21065 [Fibrobacteria bacterium]